MGKVHKGKQYPEGFSPKAIKRKIKRDAKRGKKPKLGGKVE